MKFPRSPWFAVNSRSGYSVIELMVTMTVFAIVVAVAVGSLIRIFRVQEQVVALMAANNSVSLTIEQIAREVRTGFGFSVTGGDELAFINARREAVTYRLTGDVIERSDGSAAGFQPLTADNVSVQHLRFLLLEPADFPPRIVISLGVSPKETAVNQSVINIQTTVSPRFL